MGWLPKWSLDVATAVHFWEAVLATLAIVVWYLYWVIFDPDVYPMDMSGGMDVRPHRESSSARADAAGEGSDDA